MSDTRQAGWMPKPLLFDHGGEHGQCVSLYDYNYLRATAVELTKFQLERAAAIARNDALEEAAKLCDRLRNKNYSSEEWVRGTDDCAAAIRAMGRGSDGQVDLQ